MPTPLPTRHFLRALSRARIAATCAEIAAAAVPIVAAFIVVAVTTAILNENDYAGWKAVARTMSHAGAAAAMPENSLTAVPTFD